MEKSNDAKDTDKLLIFTRGSNSSFETMEELLTMGSLKGKTHRGSVWPNICSHGAYEATLE